MNGLDRFKARKVAVEKLTELGALEKEEPYTNNVGFSERADVPIEPRLSEQWFLKYPSAEKSRACVAQEDVRSRRRRADPRGSSADAERCDGTSALPKMHFHPDRWAKVYDHWMGEHPGLVHQPPALVGTSDSGVDQNNSNAGTPDFHVLQTQLQSFKQSGTLIHLNIYAPHSKKDRSDRQF